MKKILKFSATALALLVVTSGCIKETFPNEGAATSDQVAESPTALEAMVSAIPVSMILPGTVSAYSSGTVHLDFAYPAICMAREVQGQDIGLSHSYYDWFSTYAQNQYLDEAHIYVALTWFNYYPWIKACNDVIGTIDPETEDATQRAYLGIVHTYRALFYLELTRMYEYKGAGHEEIQGLGVPYVTELTTEEQAKSNPRAPVADLYKYILEDLDKAEGYLVDYRRTNKTMPDLSVAYGVKARTYLAMTEKDASNFAKAAEYARKAIDASGCTPMTQSQWLDPKNGFNRANEAWMWGLTVAEENTYALYSFVAHMCPEATYGYASYDTREFRVIDRRLYESIPEGDFRKYAWLDPDRSVYNYVSNVPDDFLLENYGIDSPYLDACADYTQLKFRPGSGNYIENKVANAIDFPLMRVEEMYLIEAEALAMAGNVPAGQEALNNFMTFRVMDGSYDCSDISDPVEFQKEVLLQKRIELWGEGQIWFDWKRLGWGIERGYEGTNHCQGYRFNTTGLPTWYNWVISRNEVNNNPALAGYNNPDPSYNMVEWTGTEGN